MLMFLFVDEPDLASMSDWNIALSHLDYDTNSCL